MSYSNGTATSHTDLYNKLLTFLQTNAALVAAGQAWTVAWTAPGGAPNATDIVLKGPGLSGTDEVYIGLRLLVDSTNLRYTILMCGMTGILAGATEYDGHVNCSPSTRMFLTSSSMSYWFVANGRRFIAAAKVSTVYEMLYGGLILPYSLPSSYPYPMFIGGTAGEGTASVDWRATSLDHTLFHKPYSTAASVPGSYLLSPSGSWLKCGSAGSTAANCDAYIAPDIYWPQGFTVDNSYGNGQYGQKDIKDKTTACYGGAFPLMPFTLHAGATTVQTYGLLHGAFHVPGIGNSAENIITVDSVNYLVLQNVFRGTVGEYLAMALE